MMFKAIWKSLTGNKETVKAIWKLFYTSVGYISSIYAFATLLEELGITDKLVMLVKAHIWIVISIGICAAVVQQRERLTYSHKVLHSDMQVEICVRDIFWIKADSYVIPTNTFFRTKMDGEYISPRSVQGRFQQKYYKDGMGELDTLISKSLRDQGVDGTTEKDQFGEVQRYPIGTVAKVDKKRKHYYFVAINDVNEYGKPINQEDSNVDIALDGLLKYICKFGHCDDLCLPLIGTGKAAIKEATIEKVFQRTVNKFIDSDEKISRKLIVCINPKDYVEERAELSKMEKYLNYRCEFWDN